MILNVGLKQGEVTYHRYFLDSPSQLNYYIELVKSLAWQQDEIKIFGKQVAIPRMQAWYGDPEALYRYSGVSMTPRPWNKTLFEIKQKVEQQLNCRFNSVLANYYRNGMDKMGCHSDDEKELGEQPVIASLSLGVTRRFVLKHKHTDEKSVIDLAGGSLLVMSGETQKYYKHSINQQKKILDGRINLTFRYTYPTNL